MGYATKSKRGALPKMVLLGDIVGEDEASVAAATSEVVRLANARSGEGFIAVSAEARKKFWLDRAKTAAIAKHTNAFKINEDVVIPLERLGEYTDAIERINIELSIQNKLELVDSLDRYFTGAADDGSSASTGVGAASMGGTRAAAPTGTAGSDDADLDRRAAARELLGRVRTRYQFLLESMICRSTAFVPLSKPSASGCPATCRERCSIRLQDRSIRVSWKTEIRAELARIFVGAAFAQVIADCDAIHKRVLQGRVFVALHMHAGDGNVHTNIPVNSDNYAMLKTANRAVARNHADRARFERRDFRRARHWHHETRVPDRRGALGLPAYKQRIDPEAASTRTSSCRAAIFAAPILPASGCWDMNP